MSRAKPLRILVDPSLVALAWVEDLRQHGHTVVPMANEMGAEFDLILGPTCCRFLPGMEPFVPVIINGVRKAKYPAKEKRT